MASPTAELYSSESNTPQHAAHELAMRLAAESEKTDGGKGEGCRSPTSDHRVKGSQGRKSAPPKSGWGDEGGSEGSGAQQPGCGRKKRSRGPSSTSAADDMETNGRKSATDLSRESSLWPGADGEGPVQGSLLEEVLAEKRMALMRSPEVMWFLRQRQAAVQAAHQEDLLQSQPCSVSVGDLEQDADS